MSPSPQPSPSGPRRRRAGRTGGLAGLVLLLAALAGPALLPPIPVGAAVEPGRTEDPLEATAWWMAEQLERGPVAVGVALDMVLALHAADLGQQAAVRALDRLAPRIPTFVADPQGRLVPGALGKALTASLASGRGPTYGGLDLEAALRSTLPTEGRDAGMFPSVHGLQPTGQGFTQSWALLALVRTDAGIPPEALAFTLSTQCPSGGFRGHYGRISTCAAGSGHVDATAIIVQALLAAPPTPEIGAAVDRAADWLAAVQRADGSFTDGDAIGPNTNSTGLAGVALAAAGRTDAAGRAGQWVAARQLGCAGPADHRGAIAWQRLDDLGPDRDLDTWQRATAQAVLALPRADGRSLPSYGSVTVGGLALARPLSCPDDHPDDGTGGPPPAGDGEPGPPPTTGRPDRGTRPDAGDGGGTGTGGPSGTGTGGDHPGGGDGAGSPGPGASPAPPGGRPDREASGDDEPPPGVVTVEDAEPGPGAPAAADRDATGPLPVGPAGPRPTTTTRAPDQPFPSTALVALLGTGALVAVALRLGLLERHRHRAAAARDGAAVVGPPELIDPDAADPPTGPDLPRAPDR